MAGCGKSGSSSDEGSEGETTTTRKTITTAPVVETLGDLDLSDVQNKNDIPANFKYEAEAEDGELSVLPPYWIRTLPEITAVRDLFRSPQKTMRLNLRSNLKQRAAMI